MVADYIVAGFRSKEIANFIHSKNEMMDLSCETLARSIRRFKKYVKKRNDRSGLETSPPTMTRNKKTDRDPLIERLAILLEQALEMLVLTNETERHLGKLLPSGRELVRYSTEMADAICTLTKAREIEVNCTDQQGLDDKKYTKCRNDIEKLIFRYLKFEYRLCS